MLILEASSKWCETGGEMANYRRWNIHLVYLKTCESLRRRGGLIHVRLLRITWEKFWAVADFQNEKSRIEWFSVEDKGHLMYMLPKFLCELNHIERVWALESFWNITLDLVTLESMQKHFRTVRHYTFAYLDVPGGFDFKKISHKLQEGNQVSQKNFWDSVRVLPMLILALLH